MLSRLQTTVILAMTADGKIADFQRQPARFSSENDQAHLERQISLADAVIIGANTLRAYGTSLPITSGNLLAARKQQGKAPQPIHIICSTQAEIDPNLRFFQQPIPRWLLTTNIGARRWQEVADTGFDRIIITEAIAADGKSIDWLAAWVQFSALGLRKLAILGGGELVASLLKLDLIDELWLTICPVIFGGKTAPTPVEGRGFLASVAKKLELLQVENIGGEVFLHYRVSREGI